LGRGGTLEEGTKTREYSAYEKSSALSIIPSVPIKTSQGKRTGKKWWAVASPFRSALTGPSLLSFHSGPDLYHYEKQRILLGSKKWWERLDREGIRSPNQTGH